MLREALPPVNSPNPLDLARRFCCQPGAMKLIPSGAEEYAAILDECVGRQLEFVRLQRRFKLSDLTIPKLLSDQEVSNHELRGRSRTLFNLAL